jgi:membrane dipeptidase
MMSRFIVDAHYDLGHVLFNRYQMGESDVIKELLLPEWKKSSVKLIIAAIFIDDHFLPESGLRHALNQIALIKEEVNLLDNVVIVKDANDLDCIMNSDKIGVLLSLEGLEPIGTDISLLDTFYDLGVRAAGLTWSRQNAVADGSRFGNANTNLDLTHFGKQVVDKMRSKGMLVDVSHLNDAGVEALEGTIFASHSNARAVHNITRNLTDGHIKKIGQSEGIIGINGIRPIVGHSEDIKALCDHLDHIKSLIGIEHVCFGFDKCNDLENTSLRYGNESNGPIDVIGDYKEVELLIEELKKRGYTDDDIDKISYKNVIEFLRGNL